MSDVKLEETVVTDADAELASAVIHVQCQSKILEVEQEAFSASRAALGVKTKLLLAAQLRLAAARRAVVAASPPREGA